MDNLFLWLGIASSLICLTGGIYIGFYIGVGYGAKKVGEMSEKAHKKLTEDKQKKEDK